MLCAVPHILTSSQHSIIKLNFIPESKTLRNNFHWIDRSQENGHSHYDVILFRLLYTTACIGHRIWTSATWINDGRRHRWKFNLLLVWQWWWRHENSRPTKIYTMAVSIGQNEWTRKKNKINEKHNVQQPCSSCSMCSNQFIPDLKASTKCWNVVVVAFAGAVELATIYTYGEREWERVEQIHITRVLS